KLSKLATGRFAELFFDDLVTQIDALVADVHPRPCDELLHLLLALAAERALEQVISVADACHAVRPSVLNCIPGRNDRGSARRAAVSTTHARIDVVRIADLSSPASFDGTTSARQSGTPSPDRAWRVARTATRHDPGPAGQPTRLALREDVKLSTKP